MVDESWRIKYKVRVKMMKMVDRGWRIKMVEESWRIKYKVGE